MRLSVAKLRSLLGEVGKVNLAAGKTPIHDMPAIARELGVAHAWIKRDDLTGVGPGGNKVRNLEYIMKQAKDQGANIIIASGPVQSNLCTATACARRKMGMDCVLVQNGPNEPGSVGNRLLNRISGADIVYLGDVTSTVRNAHMQDVKRDLEASGMKPFVVENGASTGYGALGYVDAVCEILEQSGELVVPIRTIFVPAGNGGVAAGTVYGNYLLGLPFKVVVISTEYAEADLKVEMMKIIREAEAILGVEFKSSLDDVCLITDDYCGGGWSINTPESEEAVYHLAQKEGIFLENVYTSKTFVGYCDLIKKGLVPSEGNLFLHSGGFGSLFAQYL